MLIRIRAERPIGYTAVPVAAHWCTRFADHMYEYTGHRDSSVYWQEDWELPKEVTQHRQYGELRKGWSIVIRINPWTYGHWLGWDAQNVAE